MMLNMDSSFATVVQDLGDCETQPAVFYFHRTDAWWLTDQRLGGPLTLLPVIGYLCGLKILPKMAGFAQGLREGQHVDLGTLGHFYAVGDTLFSTRTFPGGAGVNLLANLLMDSFVLRMLADLSGLVLGAQTVVFHCTSANSIGLVLPASRRSMVDDDGSGAVTIDDPVPDLGLATPIVAQGDSEGREVIADLEELNLSSKIICRSRFARRVVAPLVRYRETKDEDAISSIADPYVSDAMLRLHRSMN
jgi:hypothetical protein